MVTSGSDPIDDCPLGTASAKRCKRTEGRCAGLGESGRCRTASNCPPTGTSRPSPGAWRWEGQGCCIVYKFSPEAPALWLDYTVELLDAQPKMVAYGIRLVAEPRHFGGTRWLFVCPLATDGVACARRVGTLYALPGAKWFGCRHCYRLA